MSSSFVTHVCGKLASLKVKQAPASLRTGLDTHTHTPVSSHMISLFGQDICSQNLKMELLSECTNYKLTCLFIVPLNTRWKFRRTEAQWAKKVYYTNIYQLLWHEHKIMECTTLAML